MDIFYHLGHNGFELYTCACWTLLTHTVLCLKPEETVYRFLIFLFNIMSDSIKHFKDSIYLYKSRYIIQRERQHELEGGKNIISNNVFGFAYISEIGLLFYEANSSSVLFIHMNILL